MSDPESLPEGLLLTWYGDDFTGSAAVMEVLSFAGLPSVLFLDVPTDGQLARFDDVRGIGIASTARAQSPDWMEAKLPRAFDWLAGQRAPITHYKVCSTFDSSPSLGSIGKAADIAADRFPGGWMPCLVAAPAIRRFQAFGHLFAAAPDGVYRLDRHPVMARHPVTPMDESDVARHLARQTRKTIGLVSIEGLESDANEALRDALASGAQIVVLDTVTNNQLARCGQLLWENRDAGLFAIGSQGVEYALVAHWQTAGQLPAAPLTQSAGPVDQMVVVSGSVSSVTEAQIAWAERHGFEITTLDAAAVTKSDAAAEVTAYDTAVEALSRGRDALIVTARGPNDPAIVAQRNAVDATELSTEKANARIGQALGRILARVIESTGLSRAAISGGDTSGYASRELGLYAFTALAPTIPGAALLEAHSESACFDGLQIALKGGQMGSEDYFGWIKRGGGDALPQSSRTNAD